MTTRIAVPLPKAYLLLNHGPTVLVSSAHGGRRNVMAAAWNMALDFDPPKVAVVIDKTTLTRELVEAGFSAARALTTRRGFPASTSLTQTAVAACGMPACFSACATGAGKSAACADGAAKAHAQNRAGSSFRMGPIL